MTRKRWLVGLAAVAVAGGGIARLSTHAVRAAESELAWQTDPGGGAPEKILLDNDAVRVTLVSYPAGFHHKGTVRRPHDTLLIYLDNGNFKIAPRAGVRRATATNESNRSRIGQPAHCDPNPAKDCGAIGPDGEFISQPYIPGSIYYHPKGNVTPTVTVGQAYRVLYIELKR